MFFDFSSAFNTIQPFRLGDKLLQMGVDAHLVTWITDYLTRGDHSSIRLKNCLSDTVICSTGAPQGTVLSPVLFTLYTSDFCYNTESCHMRKFSDDTANVGCIRNGQEEEYRSLVEDFVQWCKLNHLQLNTSKTKEMVVDFRRSKPTLLPVHIDGVNVEVVSTYKYLGLHLDNKLDWSANTDALYKKGQSRLYFLRRLQSFNVCSKLLRMFYQSVVASVLFYAVVCWGGSTRKKDAGRIDRLVSTQQVGGPLELNASHLSISDDNCFSVKKYNWEAQRRPNPPMRSLTMVHNQQTKTSAHNRGLSHGYFSGTWATPEYDRFAQNLEHLHNQTRIASVSHPAFLNQAGRSMHGFEGTGNMVYNSTEHETDAIHTHSAHHIYSEPGLEDDEEDHLYAFIREPNTLDSSLPNSYQETHDEAFETDQDDDDMEHPYECIKGTNVTDSQRPQSRAQAEQSEPAEHPYQTVRELFQAVGTAEAAVAQSGPSVQVPPTLSDKREPSLTDTGTTAEYAAINWRNKSRYRTEIPLPSSSDSAPEEREEDKDVISELGPPIPEKHFIA
ncbi:hypothetical protein AALO_G00110700 [Alosa alosa]|uniref:Reverse transcriptase domain-containing protein n=1 Tax=Alosa alosa TaxID=278164 RepID=A0AAV6GP32_9TELE|nr:hypothetical protein AALO_G00110700 [Alosa alosa]